MASLEVLIRAPAPSVEVEACLLPTAQLLNYSLIPGAYAGEECREATVLITAADTVDPASGEFAPTPIFVSLSTLPPDPLSAPPPIPAGFGVVRVRLGLSAQVTAIAARGDAMVPSDASSLPGDGVVVGPGPYVPANFRQTVALWDLGDDAAFGGVAAREVRADASCTERSLPSAASPFAGVAPTWAASYRCSLRGLACLHAPPPPPQ